MTLPCIHPHEELMSDHSFFKKAISRTLSFFFCTHTILSTLSNIPSGVVRPCSPLLSLLWNMHPQSHQHGVPPLDHFNATARIQLTQWHRASRSVCRFANEPLRSCSSLSMLSPPTAMATNGGRKRDTDGASASCSSPRRNGRGNNEYGFGVFWEHAVVD